MRLSQDAIRLSARKDLGPSCIQFRSMSNPSIPDFWEKLESSIIRRDNMARTGGHLEAEAPDIANNSEARTR